MDEVRRSHNEAKRRLIERVAREGDTVLDVGCGRGGDLHKWKGVKVNLNMCEPDAEALQEARRRAKALKVRVNFYHGDIRACPANRKYDIVCYNFSLHYIFASRDLFFETLREIRKRLRPGGTLMGIIPDSEQIIFRPYKDDQGNFFALKGTSQGAFGEKVYVNLVDTPYYADGPKPEPLAHRDLLVTHLEHMGFTMTLWERLGTEGVSGMYSTFMFVYKNDSPGPPRGPEPAGASLHGRGSTTDGGS